MGGVLRHALGWYTRPPQGQVEGRPAAELGCRQGEARLSAREMKADPKRFRNVVLKRRPVGDWEPVEL